MEHTLARWDYLIVTASNEAQAAAFQSQLKLRQQLGFLSHVREFMVVADPEGRRVGSGGSTIHCLIQIVNRELAASRTRRPDRAAVESILRSKRILILHAGGDSRRLPAYGPCGKLFVPVPGESDSAFATTLFDRLAPAFLKLPPGLEGGGQVVVTSGDALILFEPSNVSLARPGMTAIACPATPREASQHGVFCAQSDGRVRLYLQKPGPSEQRRHGAVSRQGQAWLDTGIMSFDGAMAAALLHVMGIKLDRDGRMRWPPAVLRQVLAQGLDFYREICCAMGSDATATHHRRQARAAGSRWSDAALGKIFRALAGAPFHAERILHARFLHFGTTRQLITSGAELRQYDKEAATAPAPLNVNNEVPADGRIRGAEVWVEGCRVRAPLKLAGHNAVIGVDVDQPLALPAGACLEVLRGRRRDGTAAWFVRCHGIDDSFKDAMDAGATFCGRPLRKWIEQAGARAGDLWPGSISPAQRSLWNARVFPAMRAHADYRHWLWLFEPTAATVKQKRGFRSADRYSAAEILGSAIPAVFFARRQRIRAENVLPVLPGLFHAASGFSAKELAWVLARTPHPSACVAGLLREAHECAEPKTAGSGLGSLKCGRILHSLGTAVEQLAKGPHTPLIEVLPRLEVCLPADVKRRRRSAGLDCDERASAIAWARQAREAAFVHLHRTILHTATGPVGLPRNALRRDETVWGRAPARLELGGGWTDTPPYTLEHGGEVINTAVNLNGQPPIHCYGRVIPEPVIRLYSIDAGQRIEIRQSAQLLDYRRPQDNFALLKGALALAGFSPEMAPAARGKTLRRMLEGFGGGIELTTLVGIPKGSGLGTSSILGAVIIAVIHRMIGRPLAQRKLFHEVLRLEQALTTGGGWQDQIGGVVGGTKITITRPGLIPNPRIHFVSSDVLDPKTNGGVTLLYYTGLTRLAKNILQQVVGRYLDRDRSTMSALADEHEVARCIAGAMARKDAAAFGHYFDVAWSLHRQLCADVTNRQIESLLARVRPHIHGARLLGAGSGGFMLMICKTPPDAARVRRMLEARPLNDNARFFEFEINRAGLEVTAC